MVIAWTTAMAQIYQLPNGGFETWSGSATSLPSGWHSFSEARCDLSGLAALGCSFVTANHHTRSSNSHSGSYSCCVYSDNVWNHLANGNFTTGQIRIGSTTASDQTANYNQSVNNYRQAFNGYPDYLRFWASFYATGGGENARLSAIIHDNSNMRDPVTSSLQAHVVASMENVFTRTTTSQNTLNWQCFTTAFEYTSNNITPQYILITFTNNQVAEAGSTNDRLYMDDIEMIYIGKMDDIKVGDNTIPGFSPNILEYTVCYSGSLPTVTATAASQVTRERNLLNITQTAASNGYTVTINRPGSDTTYTIHFVQGPNVNVSPSSPSVCPGESVTMTASGADSYTWSNGLGNGATKTVTPTESTQYTVSGTDANGCTSTATAYVTVKPQPSVTVNGSTSATAAICSGASTTLNAVANPANATLTWAGGSVTTNPLTVNSAGTYTVTANLDGCTSTATVAVTAYDNPVVTISGPTEACSTDDITLTASGASSYVWSNNMGTSAAIHPTTSSDYTVTGTDNHGCSNTATHHLTVNTTPVVNITGTTAICAGESTTLTATSSLVNTTYLWSDNTTTSTLTVSTGGSYSVTGTLNGCSSSATVTVNQADRPSVPTVTPATRCGAGEVTLSAASSEGTIVWYASETTLSETATGTSYTFNANNTTTYYVTVRNTAGCESTPRVAVTATVNPLPNVTVTASPAAVCAGASSTLTANGATSYSWSNEATGAAITVTPAETTTYTVNGTDANNCSNSASVTVTVNPEPGVPTVTNPTVCKGTGSAPLTATVGTNGDALRWRTSPTGTPTQGASYSATSTGTYYVSTYNTTTTCESQPVTITVAATPAAPVVAPVTLCAAGTATLAVSNPDNNTTYTWYSDANLNNSVGTGSTIDVTVSQDATYYVTAQSNGCESQQPTSVAVTIGETIEAPSIATPIYACGGTATLSATDGSHTLVWKNNNGSVISDLNVSIASGSATYTATYEVNGCESQPATVTVTYEAFPTLSATGDTRCGAGEVTLTATSNGTVYWFTTQNAANAFTNASSPYAATGTNYTPNVSNTTTFYARAMSTGGCLSDVTSAVATVNTLPNVTATASPTAVCAGTSSTLTANGASSYSWSNEATGATITVTPAETTTYTVTGTDANNCTNTATVTVTVNPVPGVPTVASSTVCKGTSNAILSATAGADGNVLRWRTSPTGTPTQGDNYTATSTGTYYVSTYNSTTTCESQPVTITVVATPAAPVAAPVTLCAAGTATLAVSNPDNNTTYTWYSDANRTNSVGTGSTLNVTVSQDATYYVTAQSNGCESPATTVAVTIRETIEAPSITTPIYACGGTATLPATDGTHTLIWKNNNGTVISNLNVSIATGSAIYTANYEENGCESQPATVTVTYEAVPTLSATGDTRCGGGEVTLTANSNGTVYWFTTQNAANAFTNASSPYAATGTNYTPNVSNTTTFYARAMSTGGCLSDVTSAVATVNVLPNVTATASPAAVCAGASSTLTANGASSYSWSNEATGATITVTPAETTTYTVTGTDANNCSNTASVTVTVNTVPAAPTVTTPAPQCLTGSNVQVALTATPGEGGSYAQWYNTSMNPQTENTYSVRINTTSTYYVATVGANGCVSDTIPVTVVVNTPPSVPVVAGTSRCGAGEVTFTLAAAEHILYKWYDNNNTLLTTTTGDYTTTVDAITTFQVATYDTETGCESAKTAVTATVNTLPTAPQVTPIAHCGPTIVTLTATSNNTLTWFSDAEGTQPLTNTTQEVSQTTSFYVMATDQNLCQSALQELVVTINDIPAAPTIATPDAICGEGSATLTATPASGCTIQWYTAANEPLTQGSAYTTPTLQASTTYKATNIGLTTQCESSASTVNVVVNTLPAAPVLTGTAICGAGNATLTANTTAGTTTTWYQDADLTVTVGTGSTMTAPVTENTTFYAVNTDNTTLCVSTAANAVATVYPTYETETSATACVQYVWNEETFTESGDYPRTLYTIHGCDSLVTLHLTIHPTLQSEITIDECDSWTWNDQTYTESGDYSQTLTSVLTHCDSIVTAHVTIRHSTSSQQQLTLCSNELPYSFAGTQITNAGTKTITIQNEQGCDSIILLTVTVNPQPEMPTVTDANRCGAGNVTLHATLGTNGTNCRWYADETALVPFATGPNYTANLTETTTYYVTSYNANTGCESERVAVTATINEIPTQPTVADVERCGAGSVTMTVSPTDNTLTYRWYINNTTNTSLYTGESFTTDIQATTTYYAEAYNATTNCRSSREAVVATVNPIPAVPTTTNAESCGANVFDLENMVTSAPATTYRWYDDNTAVTPLATSSTYTTETVSDSRSFFVSNYNETTNCESQRSEIQITIHPVYEPVTLTDVVCQGEIYTAYDQYTVFEEPGDYPVVLNETSSHGCDSLVTLVITVNPTSTAAYEGEVCAGTPYQGYGFDTTAMVAGTYTLTRHNTNALGCDSTTTLTLTVNPVKTTTINTTICETASYNFNGQTLNVPGTYTANLQTVNNCDSIVTLNLSVASEYRDTIVAHICEGTSYTQNGFNENATGFYQQDLTASNNCDSVVVLNLTVHQLSTTNLTGEICEGESYTANGFNETPTEAGVFTYQRLVPTFYGCDSTVNLTLTVHPVYQYEETATACSNEVPYLWHNQSLTASGTYYDNQQSVFGCDSNYTLHLTVLPTYHHTLSVTLCDNSDQLPYMFAGDSLTTSGHYTHTFQTVNNCDSLVELDLVINPTYQEEQTVEICDNDLPYVWNNRPEFTYHQAGEYTINLQTTAGCDSIWHLNLIVHPTYERDTLITVCQGALPYHFDETHTFSEAGDYDVDLQSQYGCDSLLHVQFRVQPYARRTEAATICADALPYAYDATHSFDTAGVYDILEEHTDGCNTIVTLTLTVNPTYLHYDTVTACANTLPYVYDGLVMDTAGTYTKAYQSVSGCDSTVMVTLNVTENPTGSETVYVCQDAFPYSYAGQDYPEAGTYEVILPTAGCDSIVTLTIIEAPLFHSEESVETCENALPYLWHGQSLTENGQYTDQHQSIYGCDSTYTLNLVISNVKRSTDTVDICEGASYEWHNLTLSQSGEYLDTIQSAAGCDSICQLVLTVHPTYQIADTVTTCQSNTPYYFAAADTLLDVSTAGTQTVIFNRSSVHGCDSITTLTLVVNPTYEYADQAAVCNYDLPYEWRNRMLTEASTYYDSLQTVNGCDSVYVLSLTVKPAFVFTSDPVEICQGETYSWREHTITETGLYRDSVINAQGCYDIYEVNVTVHPTYLFTDTVTICDDALPYSWRNRSLTAAGTYDVNFQTVTLCDSIYRLVLVVNPTYSFNETLTLCADETPHTWHGQSLTATGVYTDSLQTANGCDSVYTLTLTVNPTYNFNDTMTFCANETPILWHGQSLSTTGIYTDSLQTNSGCDSVYTLALTVNPTYNFSETDSVCSYDLPYTWRGQELTASDVYYDSLQTANGCDSVYVLNLTVHPSQVFTDPMIELCDGATQTWRDQVISATGEYRDTVMNATGCYDIFVVNALVHPTYHFYDTMTVCQSALPYTWGGHTFNAAETYTLNLQTANGCDSIHEYTLFVNPTYSFSETLTLCADETPYTWHGQSLTATGVYTDSLQTNSGCDSIYTLTLTVNPTYSFNETMTLCANETPILWHGQSLTTTGIYTDSLQTNSGCDSVYTLALTVNPTYIFSETDSVCSYDLPYAWRNQELNASGVYYDSLQAKSGCDSVYVLTLTVNPSQVFTDPTIELCNGATQTWHGQEISATGEYRDTVMNATGCYDIYVVNALVHPTYHFYDTMTVCQSALPFTWGGHTFTAAETYALNLQTVNGCDSIHEYTLFVNPTYSFSETLALCADETPYTWHGKSLTATGVYTDSLQTTNGCDSIYTLTLTVNPVSHQLDSATVCGNELPYEWRGQQLSVAGHYTDTVPNSYGCSDIYELQLTVNAVPQTMLYDTVCQGEPYMQYGFDTIPTAYGTLQLQSVQTSALGCDSLVTLVLQVMPTYLFETDAATCDNVPYEWRGGEYSVAGDYYDSLTTAFGCDSVFVLHLTVNPTYDVYVSDSAVMWQEFTYGDFVLTPSDSGTFHYDIQGYTLANCDSIVHLTLYVAFADGVEEFSMTPEFSFYPNPTRAALNIRGERMRAVDVLDMHGKLVFRTDADTPEFTQLDVTAYPAGHYLVKVTLDDGKTVIGKIIVGRR